MSRYLNPNDVEDREYLIGLPAGTRPAGRPTRSGSASGCGSRTTSDETRRRPTTCEIHDTQENVYRPIPLDADQPVRLPGRSTCRADTVLPLPTRAAGQGPIQGSLLLFKLKTDSLQNRPLELRLSKASGRPRPANLDLDV